MRLKNMFLIFAVYIIPAICLLPALGASLGDPFDGTSLKNPSWQWQNEPDKWDVGKTNTGWLHIVPKVNQNLWDSDSGIRLYQEGDFDKVDIETHIVINYKGECVVGGLVIKSPADNNWTTMKFWGRAADAIIQWQHKAQEVVSNVPDSTQPAGRVEAYLRMMKDGDNYLGWWKKEKAGDWIEIKPDAPLKMTPPIQVGIFGGVCAAAGEATIEYEYFNDLINPFLAVKPGEKLAMNWGGIKSLY